MAQGLAFGLGLQVVPVGTLRACAEAARAADAQANCVVSALDARMDQAYWGVFDWQGAAHESAPMGWLCGPAAALDAPQALPVPARPYTLAGNAAAAFGERLSVWAGAAHVAAQALPNAVAIAALGWRGWSNGMALDAALAAPLYVRDNVAQTTLEREAARAVKMPEKAATEAAHAVNRPARSDTRMSALPDSMPGFRQIRPRHLGACRAHRASEHDEPGRPRRGCRDRAACLCLSLDPRQFRRFAGQRLYRTVHA